MKFKPHENEGAADDYEGTPLMRRGRELPVGAPENAESVAKSILIDLCESQDVRDSYAPSVRIDELIQRLAGVLLVNSRRENEGRTLYCFHKLPKNTAKHGVHTEALALIRDKLDALRPSNPEQWEDLPAFVFLLLADESKLQGLRSIIVTMLKRHFKHKTKRTGHGAND